MTRELTVLDTPDARKALAGQASVTVSGQLEYQACDDKVCYQPRKVPVPLVTLMPYWNLERLGLQDSSPQTSRMPCPRTRKNPATSASATPFIASIVGAEPTCVISQPLASPPSGEPPRNATM